MARPDRERVLADIAAAREYSLDEERAVTVIRRGLRDDEGSVRAEAAAAVWDYWDVPSLVEECIELASDDDDPEVRIHATTALGRVLLEWRNANLLNPSLAERVRSFLLERAAPYHALRERRYAIEALGFVGDHPDVNDLIQDLAERPEKEARISALFAMGRSGSPAWQKVILEQIEAEDDEIRLQAVWAAGEARLRAAVPALSDIATEATDTRLRATAVTALGHIGDPETAGLLLPIAADEEDEAVRDAARAALDEVVSTPADPE